MPRGKLSPSLVVVLIAILLAPLFVGCQRNEPLRGVIKIGLVAPFSGRHYAQGYEALFAVRLALREWNQKGGLAGYRLELVAEDDRQTAELGRRRAQKLALDSEVIGVLGHTSDGSLGAAAAEYATAGLPLISFGATALPADVRGIFSMNADADSIAAETARFATSVLGARRVAVVRAGGQDALAEAVAQALAAKTRVQRIELSASPQGLTGPGNEAPDLVFLVGDYEEAAAMATEIRRQHPDTPLLLAPQAATFDFVRLAGDAARDVCYLSLGLHPRDIEGAAHFREAYRALSGMEPGPTAALAYDAANALLEAASAITRNGRMPERTEIAAALADGLSHQGVTGTLAWDAAGRRKDAPVCLYRLTPDHPGQRLPTASCR